MCVVITVISVCSVFLCVFYTMLHTVFVVMCYKDVFSDLHEVKWGSIVVGQDKLFGFFGCNEGHNMVNQYYKFSKIFKNTARWSSKVGQRDPISNMSEILLVSINHLRLIEFRFKMNVLQC